LKVCVGRQAIVLNVYGGPVGPPATIVRKPRQVRKEATVVDDSGAGVWLAGLPPFRPPFCGAEALRIPMA